MDLGEQANSDTKQQTQDPSWGTPQSLDSPEPPIFPLSAFRLEIATMVAGVAEATQTDQAMAGTTALAVLAALASGRVEVEPRPGWREPTNLYTATVAAPSERKSPVQRHLATPLRLVEQQLTAQVITEREQQTELRTRAIKAAEQARIELSKAEARLQRASADDDRAAAEQAVTIATEAADGLVAAANAIVVPTMPRLLADDTTPEAVISLLADQGGRVAVVSAEGGLFDIMLGRYSNQPNLDIWLKGHAGDTVRVDRKGRPPEYVDRPALTLALMVQPDVLDGLGRTKIVHGRGLLARFLFALPVSRVGWRDIGTPLDPQAVADYGRLMLRLAELTHDHQPDPATLRFSPEAYARFEARERATEEKLRPGGDLDRLAGWGGKLMGALARIIGLLHLAEHGPAGDHWYRRPIEAATVDRAELLIDYFADCARQVFADLTADPAIRDAEYLLKRLRIEAARANHDTNRAPLATVSVREAMRIGRVLASVEQTTEALDCLADHGWLRPPPVKHDKRTRGRPDSPRYDLHPDLTATP